MPGSKSLILASASPRRKDLLQKAGYSFDVIPSDIDESVFSADNVEPADYVKKLALAKARAVAKIYPDAVVIGADTIADFDGEIIGKPADSKHAQEIIRKLFSKPHKVITALAVVRVNDNTQIVESDTTVVYPKKMTSEQIEEHIKNGNWRDKAGAYAIQETDDEFIKRIEGSLTNVMGMPVELLKEMLGRAGL